MENKALPFVSIIIPIYCVENYIKKCIESVFNQDYKGKLECILVDDCGSDKSMEIAEQLIRSYNGPINFHIIRHKNNRGLSAARNTGMSVAKGEYLFFLDSDDELTPSCMSKLSAPIQEKKYDLIVGGIQAIGRQPKRPYLKLKTGEYAGRETIYATKRSGQWYQMAQNKLYRTEFLKKNKLLFKEGIIHEDELWSFEITCLLTNMYAVNNMTYLYNIREGSIMESKDYQKRKNAFIGILNGFDTFITSHSLSYDMISNDLYFRHFVTALYLAWNYSKEEYYKSYSIFRKQKQRSLINLFISNGFSFRKQIRDVHYIFPHRIGALLCRMLLIR